MGIKLKVQEDHPKLKVGEEGEVRLNAKRDTRPVLVNDYDELIDKPSINGVELSGDKTTEDLGIDAGVKSWNGQTGDVVYTPPAPPVTSVNGETGDVVLDAEAVGALPDDTVIPSKTSQLNNDSGFVNAAGAAAAAPVQSVNGQTGVVTVEEVPDGGATGQVLTKKSDADGDTEWKTPAAVPTKVSQLQNDSAFVNAAEAAAAAPVQSVNGQTGAVTIDDEIFVAIYNTTTYADVLAAYNAGKTVFAKKDQTIYVLGSYNGTQFDFYSGRFQSTDRIGVTSSGWTAGNIILVSASREINGKPLSADITLDASDVDALPDTTKYAASPEVGGSATFANGIHYAAVKSTSTSTAFKADIPAITEYYDGLTIMLFNGVVTSAANFTIEINDLGALGSYSNMALGNQVTPTSPTRDTTIFNINYAMIFTYCSHIGGGSTAGWIGYRGYDANTNTIGYQVRTNSYSLPMKSITYRYRLLFTSADNEHWVPATNSTSTNATAARNVCQDAINPFGSIVYYGTTSSVAAGSRPSVSYLWQQYAFNLGYSFQKSPNYSLTSWKPVYLKCAPQSDGSAIIDSTEPFVQDLPAAADGKIYIQLGVAYSTTSIELTLNHPVYYIDATGRRRLWTGEDISNLA